MSKTAITSLGNPNGERLRALASVPGAVAQADALISGLDRCLLVGFGRLGSEQTASLSSCERAFEGTPLGPSLGKALAALRSNEFVPAHFATLAAARAALQGARHDALHAQASVALGRASLVSQADSPTSRTAPASVGLCDSTRHWLMELAVTGFKQLETPVLAPFAATLESLQADPSMTRLATVLTGFQRELLAALPIGHASAVPVYRWADLWTASMIASLQVERPDLHPRAIGTLHGTLTVLGVDLRQHGFFASPVVYAYLDAEERRIVRITLSSYKVDALRGPELWRCFAGDAALLQAIGDHVPLAVDGLTLLETGDALWDGQAKVAGKPADVFALASRCLVPDSPVAHPSTPPQDRHPVQLAELVFVQGLRFESDDAGSLAAHIAEDLVMPVAMSRLAAVTELTREDLLASNALIGLLRFDAGRWAIQPLVVTPGEGKKAVAFVGQNAHGIVTAKPKRGQPNTLLVLQERASRLLRKKA